MSDTPALARLPSVDEVLRHPAFAAAAGGLADAYRTRLVRQTIQTRRRRLLDDPPADGADVRADVVADCAREARALARPFPRRVINATGVLLHTNLGRAPLGELLAGLEDTLGGYTDLEWDEATLGRGNRDEGLAAQLRLLTGAESAIVVNNCASALLLALHTLAAGRAALVSRSELVEIGGSFRVPEIIEASGCRLREVGTTNRTRAADFERAATDGGAAVLLKVHQSNFVQRGFVESVSTDEMVALGRALGVPVLEDNGSGLVVPNGAPPLGDEPHVAASVARGVDVVCFSGDKLLGGVQAGIVVGRAPLVDAMRRNPLFRALRLDKVRIALLHRCLAPHLAGDERGLPLWRLFHADVDEVRARASTLRLPSWARPVPLRATLGGGSNPEADFPSWGLELAHPTLGAERVRRALAGRDVPIVGYVRQDRCFLDVRTVLPADLPEIQAALDTLDR
ncbi:L-seryl-tRNA(Sec) selenium transferase (plasmid) [Gemmatirosa kalamazoonensis]|uniref:L-seryl-tRNA(Sec) selenium transferase n=1 Tax=Gemmatirosa kalamazoonensis TaxID=861299 RepID=W0RT29_9BACT|nr:L-seryl-tRNA(Sec) selenium transferase [Gemmatirosa kalamazoonensis]AHG93475.1 L-seryl-tRNA(Sec) selenium transferase [Gemmatirosa kalamazoonensis]